MQEAGPLKSQVREFWNRQSCDTDATRAEKFSRDYFEEIEAFRYRDQPFIHPFAQFSRYHGKQVLEVGFGAGTDFIQWLRAGAIVSGIDLTPEALANLTHRIQRYQLPPAESIQVADAENLPFPTDTFDLGYSFGVLHHSPDTEKALRELVRVVRPGGEIKVMLYNRHSFCIFKTWVKFAVLRVPGRPVPIRMPGKRRGDLAEHTFAVAVVRVEHGKNVAGRHANAFIHGGIMAFVLL